MAVDLGMKGWKVIILDLNQDAGVKAASDIGGDFFKADVRSWQDQYAAFETAFDKYGRVDFGKSSVDSFKAWACFLYYNH